MICPTCGKAQLTERPHRHRGAAPQPGSSQWTLADGTDVRRPRYRWTETGMELDRQGAYLLRHTVPQSEDRAEPGLRADSLRAALEPRKRDWIDCEANAAHNVSYDLIARLLARAALGASAGLDVERLSIAMNRAYTFGTGTAEEVAAEYARLSVPSEPVE